MNVPALGIGDIEHAVRADSSLEWIGYGFKSCDSMQRRARMASWPNGICDKYKLFAPLKSWTHTEVKAYLNRNRIQIPDMHTGTTQGLSLSPESMRYLRDNWPDDYKRVLKVFPEAVFQAARADTLDEEKKRAEEIKRAISTAERAAKDGAPKIPIP